jgi:surface protein
MFNNCSSLKKLNLGNIDFALSRNFESMFSECYNLEELDVSHFNTKNSLNFGHMFDGCRKLKIIDVSKFNSSKCTTIESMFSKCESLSEIDMINWDMSSIKIIYNNKYWYCFSNKKYELSCLFEGCKNLKKIKMSSNFSDDAKQFLCMFDIFRGLPEGGKFYWRKGITCNQLLNQLPVSWKREQE